VVAPYGCQACVSERKGKRSGQDPLVDAIYRPRREVVTLLVLRCIDRGAEPELARRDVILVVVVDTRADDCFVHHTFDMPSASRVSRLFWRLDKR
jgi:hypothetical protein